jgi:hypothetical protein
VNPDDITPRKVNCRQADYDFGRKLAGVAIEQIYSPNSPLNIDCPPLFARLGLM